MTRVHPSLRIHDTWKVGPDLTDNMRKALVINEVQALAEDPLHPNDPPHTPVKVMLVYYDEVSRWWLKQTPQSREIWEYWCMDTLEDQAHDTSAAAYFYARKQRQRMGRR